MSATKALREWRGERSQAEVALELGIDQSTYSRLESGSSKPTLGLGVLIEQKSDGRVPVALWLAKAKTRKQRTSQA